MERMSQAQVGLLKEAAKHGRVPVSKLKPVAEALARRGYGRVVKVDASCKHEFLINRTGYNKIKYKI